MQVQIQVQIIQVQIKSKSLYTNNSGKNNLDTNPGTSQERLWTSEVPRLHIPS